MRIFGRLEMLKDYGNMDLFGTQLDVYIGNILIGQQVNRIVNFLLEIVLFSATRMDLNG